jgi:hypothetical protein
VPDIQEEGYLRQHRERHDDDAKGTEGQSTYPSSISFTANVADGVEDLTVDTGNQYGMSTGKLHGPVLASALRVFISSPPGEGAGWLRHKSALILPQHTGIV